MCGTDKTCDFFCFDRKAQRWNLLVMPVAIIGGFVASNYLSDNQVPDLNPATVGHWQAHLPDRCLY